MAKVLLADTNFSSQPIYRALLELGHEVHVVGANPADCLAKVCKNYWKQDYSDVTALEDLIRSQNFEFLVPGCTDKSYESCLLAGKGRFPGFDSQEAASSIGHKARFRELAQRTGLSVPKRYLDKESDLLGTVIVKPVDSFSGKGISVLHSPGFATLEQARRLAQQASPSGDCLVEEFVEGQLYSYSAFLARQKVVNSFLVQEDCTANPFVVDTSRVLANEDHKHLLDALQENVETIALHLGLADGLLHTQFISNGEQHWLIELTRRCPGDLYSQLIELSTGVPYAHQYASAFLGVREVVPQGTALRAVMRHTISVPREQSFNHVTFDRRLMIERYIPLCLVGDQLQASPASRVAVVFCREDCQEKLDIIYRAALSRELYRAVG